MDVENKIFRKLPKRLQPVHLYSNKLTILFMSTKIEFIAEACHEANRVLCRANGDDSQKHWPEAEQWQRDAALAGVLFRLENPDAGSDAQHVAWMNEKLQNGWVYGEVKSAENKTHPCLVPFDELPEFERKKDVLFCAIVDALK